MSALVFHWQTSPHRTLKTSQFCDMSGVGRLLVRRQHPRGRTFVALINNDQIGGVYPTIGAAKAAAQREVESLLLSGAPIPGDPPKPPAPSHRAPSALIARAMEPLPQPAWAAPEGGAPSAHEALEAIAAALDGPRDRLGRLTPDPLRVEPLRKLAVRLHIGGAADTIEQAMKVARAVLARREGAP